MVSDPRPGHSSDGDSVPGVPAKVGAPLSLPSLADSPQPLGLGGLDSLLGLGGSGLGEGVSGSSGLVVQGQREIDQLGIRVTASEAMKQVSSHYRNVT